MSAIDFETFWAWVIQHPNCILRVNTPDAVLYDDEDLHWYLGPTEGLLVIQVIRGKRLMGEIILDPERVTYVQDVGEEREGEHLFELISEQPTDRVAAYVFVLSHGLDESKGDDTAAHGPAVH